MSTDCQRIRNLIKEAELLAGMVSTRATLFESAKADRTRAAATIVANDLVRGLKLEVDACEGPRRYECLAVSH